MKELEMAAQAGHSAEYTRNHDLDNKRSLAILYNYFEIDPVRPDYASITVEEAFDWEDIHDKITTEHDLPPETPLFVFGFYSEPKELTDEQREELDVADIAAFFEARGTNPDEFLYYFRGTPDINGKVMSFCIWTTPEAAHSVTTGEAHQAAAKLAKPSYKSAHVKGYAMAQAGKGDEVMLQQLFEHQLNVGD